MTMQYIVPDIRAQHEAELGCFELHVVRDRQYMDMQQQEWEQKRHMRQEEVQRASIQITHLQMQLRIASQVRPTTPYAVLHIELD